MMLEWKKLKELGFVFVFLILLGVFVTSIVSMPAFFGVLTIVMGDTFSPSPVESIGLALLSAALAGVIFVIVTPRLGSTNGNSSEDVTRQTRPVTRIIGIYFAIAAVAFTMFATLCPFLEGVLEGQRFFAHTAFGEFSEVFVRWISVGSLFVGACALVVSIILGPFLFAADMLRKKKRM